MQTFKKLFFFLSLNERKNAGFLLIMITIMSLIDVIGVASILPFIAVLTNPSLIDTNLILNTMFQFSKIFKVENSQQFIFVLGFLVFLLLVFSLTFKAFTTYVQARFILMREYSISRRLVEGYLGQPYSWFLGRHSAELGKNILSEVGIIIGSGLTHMMELLARGIVVITLITLLIIVNPKLALIVGLTISGMYLLIFYLVQGFLKRIGNKRLKNNELRFTTINEAFGAVKEVKVGGLEQTYIKSFSDSAKIFALTQASSQVISQLPRFILEVIGFGGILLIILYTMGQTGNFNSALPILSLYVFAGYRLMPALQQIYHSSTQLTFVGPSIDKLARDIKNLKPPIMNQDKGVLYLNKAITLKNIHYEYPNASRTALNDVNLSISSKTTVGLVGMTGSGKTTTVDIILGLLEPQKGTLEVDGKVITKQNSRSWQRSIGYVPQHIYLSDDTVAANIAFGVEPQDIDLEAVEKAAKTANLHNFLIDELPKKYETTIGERGVRLSGGQRQRIGIARALYYNPSILILDEATSALDSQTEKAVMDAVNNLRKDITIIIIAHRLATIKKCDKIFLLEKGQIKNEGTFEELKDVNENFRLNVNN